jgi:hypothetical protein
MRMLSILFVATMSLTAIAQTRPVPPSETVINGRALTEQQKAEFQRIYGVRPFAGEFWYDSRSGLFGLWGRETLGMIYPGHDYGPLAANASAGHTGVFINGREINLVEAMYLQSLLGAVYRGRWWLDGRGNFGVEGNPIPAGNLMAVVQASQHRKDQAYRWRNGLGDSVLSGGGCTGAYSKGAEPYFVGCDK